MRERYGRARVTPGFEKATAEYISDGRQALPTEEIIRRTTTNGREIFQNAHSEWSSDQPAQQLAHHATGVEDALSVQACLGTMEFLDRQREGRLDDQFLADVRGAIRNSKISANSVHSDLEVPAAKMIEHSVTGGKGYEPDKRVRRRNFEDRVALKERLGWMDLMDSYRRGIVMMSLARDWSAVNIGARLNPKCLVDKPRGGILRKAVQAVRDYFIDYIGIDIPRGYDKDGDVVSPVLAVYSGDPARLPRMLVDANINAHFGSVVKGPDGRYLMMWDGSFAMEHLEAVVNSQGKGLDEETFEKHRKVIAPHLAGLPVNGTYLRG